MRVKVESTAASSNSSYITATQSAALLKAPMERSSPPSTTPAYWLPHGYRSRRRNRQQAAVINGVSDLRSDPSNISLMTGLFGNLPEPPCISPLRKWRVVTPHQNLNILKVADSDPLGVTINGTVIAPSVVDDQRAKGIHRLYRRFLRLLEIHAHRPCSQTAAGS